jgi:4,5-dihydroxyphthalate decarboxylase
MTSSRATLKLKIALAETPYYASLRDGSLQPEGIELEFADISQGGIVGAYRRMARDLEFDICQFSFVSYVISRAYNAPYTAIPVIPTRAVHHGAGFYNTNVASTPNDIAGKKFAMVSYTVTPGTWVRGFLSDDFGARPELMQYVINREEHIAEYQLPANVEFRRGADLRQAFIDGEFAAAHGPAINAGQKFDVDYVKPVYPDPVQASRDYYKRTGTVPFNDFIVIQNAVLNEHDWVAPALFEAFKEAKEKYLRENPGAKIGGADLHDGDPLPYGVEPNRVSMETLTRYSIEAGMIHEAPDFYALFTPNTCRLT